MTDYNPQQQTRIDHPNGEPLVSILIAAYNEAAYIEECLDSCLRQTYRNIEVCVVDDGSSDETPKIVARYSKQHNQVKFLSLPRNRGKNTAFNHAFEMSTGDYVALMGADDTSMPHRIAISVSAVQSSGAGLVAFAFDRCTADLVPKSTTVARKANPSLKDFVYGNPMTGGGTFFMRRVVASQVFPLPAELPNEDRWIGFSAVLSGFRVRNYSDVVLRYRIHGNNDNGRMRYTLSDRVSRTARSRVIQSLMLQAVSEHRRAVSVGRGFKRYYLISLAAHRSAVTEMSSPLRWQQRIRLATRACLEYPLPGPWHLSTLVSLFAGARAELQFRRIYTFLGNTMQGSRNRPERLQGINTS